MAERVHNNLPERTQWDQWGLIPKDSPDFKTMVGLGLRRSKDPPSYKDYVVTVMALAVKENLDALIITPEVGETPVAVVLTFIPMPDTLFAKQARPAIDLICALKYARPCWGTAQDCVCGPMYTLDCNNTALRTGGKVYALCTSEVRGSTKRPKRSIQVVTKIPEQYETCFSVDTVQTLGIGNNNVV